MFLRVSPTEQLKGFIYLPASKSYSIRAFIIAACGGSSEIIAPSNCDDALVAKKIAQLLGADIEEIKPNQWKIQANKIQRTLQEVHVKESGTALRFILPLLVLRGKDVTVDGEGTLKGRPNTYLIETLRSMGADIEGEGVEHSVPIRIGECEITGGKLEIDGGVSSQFISALLITCPQLKDDSRLMLVGKKIVSIDYITMTVQILKLAGIDIEQKNIRDYHIKGNQKFKGLKKFHVPSDYGLAAFHLAAAALLPSDVILKGALRDDLIQADGHILPLLKKMGVTFDQTRDALKVNGPFNLKGGIFSLKDCPDLVPIMSILALFADKQTKLTHIAHARVKESDRISDLREELLKIGADVQETEDELIINPLQEYKQGCELDPHNDHRLAMAFSVLGLKIGVKIKNIECTHKSYPNFVDDFRALGAKVT